MKTIEQVRVKTAAAAPQQVRIHRVDKQRSDRTNYLNTALILLSFALALVVPFELFIGAYVLLGPLHYLTEIGWLHRRNYFVGGGKSGLWLWVLAGCATVAFLTGTQGHTAIIANVTLIAFLSASILLLFREPGLRILLVLLMVMIVPPMVLEENSLTYVAFYLSTLIHVFCFTALFMLLGSLKEKSFSSIVALTTLILCAINLLFGAHPVGTYHPASDVLKNALAFGSIERTLANTFGWTPGWDASVHAMRFIAFAYTYHYLNWFSKTNVIAWHKVGRAGWITIGLVYTAALVLYVVDFKLGLKTLFVLSIGHVFLEFPLNCWSIGAIGKEIGALAATGACNAPPQVGRRLA